MQPFADQLVVEGDGTLVRQGLSPHTMRKFKTSVVGQWVKTRKNGSHEVANVSSQFSSTSVTPGGTRSELLAGILHHGIDVLLTTVVVGRQRKNGLNPRSTCVDHQNGLVVTVPIRPGHARWVVQVGESLFCMKVGDLLVSPAWQIRHIHGFDHDTAYYLAIFFKGSVIQKLTQDSD